MSDHKPVYQVTSTPPLRRDNGRVGFVDTMCVYRAIFDKANAHLSLKCMRVLNAIWMLHCSYGRFDVLRISHAKLAEYTGMHPRVQGPPLKELADQGFIDYRGGDARGSAGGHSRTQSEITVRIPEGWERYRSVIEGRSSDEALDFDGLEGDTANLTESVSYRSPIRRDSTAETHRNDEVAERGNLTKSVPLKGRGDFPSPKGSKTGTLLPPDRKADGPSGVDLDLVAQDLESVTPDQAVELLRKMLSEDGRKVLDPHRRAELSAELVKFGDRTPDASVTETLYLMGYWAGNRRLKNANFACENMLRNREKTPVLEELLPLALRDVIGLGLQHGGDARPRERVESPHSSAS